MIFFRILFILLFARSALAQPGADFDIAAQPSPPDWEYFFKLDDQSRMKLWIFHKKRNRGLAQWSWEWRLAWVRACIKSDQSYCQEVLDQALNDNALVVRAEVATQLGIHFANTKNIEVIEKLSTLFQDKRNVRNGKPLYIQQRILYAISEIGGELAVTTGARLANQHRSTNAYWTKLRRL